MKKGEISVTVFTPTYNRAYILENLYLSLCKQSNDSFEWLIIDDASTDNTENLVKQFKKNKNKFEIRYIKQEHGGKHRAMNKAFDLAKGKYFFTVDSDDFITDDAIENIIDWFQTINSENICAVSGMKVLKNGDVCGGNINKDYIDASNFEREKYNLLGDKAEVYYTDIIKKYRFPEYENEFFVTEDYIYMQAAYENYKIRWFNHPIYVCEYLEDGLTNKGLNDYSGHIKNFKGYTDYIAKCVYMKTFSQAVLHLNEYNKTCNLMKYKLEDKAKGINISLFKYILYAYVFVLPVRIYKKLFRGWRKIYVKLFKK